MDTDLNLAINRTSDIPVLDVSGDVDEFTCAKLREALRSFIREGEFRIVVNVSGVKFMDSSGLGTLVGGLRRMMENNGGLALSGTNSQVERILTVTGLDRILKLHNDDYTAACSLRTQEEERKTAVTQ